MQDHCHVPSPLLSWEVEDQRGVEGFIGSSEKRLLKKESILESAFESSVEQSYHSAWIKSDQTSHGRTEISPEQQFQSIAPHLTKIDTLPRTNSIATEAPDMAPTRTTTLSNSNFTPLYDNFYLSDVITKSSITMGKCATQSRNNGNFF